MIKPSGWDITDLMGDFDDKIRLETQLRPKLREYNTEVITDFIETYASTGGITSMSDFNADLSDILINHYEIVATEFDNRISQTLPSDVQITDEEEDLITAALLTWLLIEAPNHAKLINATTQDNMLDAVRLAVNDPLVRDLSGLEAQRTAAMIAGRQVERDLMGREGGILMTETQTPAETAKATEAEILAGQTPSIEGGSAQESEINKEWVSRGDARVRDSHISADGQIVPMNQPFNVGGESLQWPGDRTLGASLGNIVNCRCEANYNTETIMEMRRERNV